MELFSILQNKWKKNPFIIIFIYMSLGERIKQARIAKGLKQKEFALLLKIDNSQYSKIERDKLLPTLNQLIDIVKTLEVTFEWLINGATLAHNVHSIENQKKIESNLDLALQNIKLQEEIIKLQDILHNKELELIKAKNKNYT